MSIEYVINVSKKAQEQTIDNTHSRAIVETFSVDYVLDLARVKSITSNYANGNLTLWIGIDGYYSIASATTQIKVYKGENATGELLQKNTFTADEIAELKRTTSKLYIIATCPSLQTDVTVGDTIAHSNGVFYQLGAKSDPFATVSVELSDNIPVTYNGTEIETLTHNGTNVTALTFNGTPIY